MPRTRAFGSCENESTGAAMNEPHKRPTVRIRRAVRTEPPKATDPVRVNRKRPPAALREEVVVSKKDRRRDDD